MSGLVEIARTLIAGGKGLLAMDESTGTCNKRFEEAGIPQIEEARRTYRELIVTTPGLAESISGTILYDETIRQKTKDGRPFVEVLKDAGIIPGIKVDLGAKDLAGHPGEKITEGLDTLWLAMPRGDRARAAKCIRPDLHARRDAGGDDPETKHGAAGIDLSETSDGG